MRVYYITSENLVRVLKNFTGLHKYKYILHILSGCYYLLIYSKEMSPVGWIKIQELQVEIGSVTLQLPTDFVSELAKTPFKNLPKQFDIICDTQPGIKLLEGMLQSDDLRYCQELRLTEEGKPERVEEYAIDTIDSFNVLQLVINEQQRYADALYCYDSNYIALDSEWLTSFTVGNNNTTNWFLPIKLAYDFLGKLTLAEDYYNISSTELRFKGLVKLNKSKTFEIQLGLYISTYLPENQLDTLLHKLLTSHTTNFKISVEDLKRFLEVSKKDLETKEVISLNNKEVFLSKNTVAAILDRELPETLLIGYTSNLVTVNSLLGTIITTPVQRPILEELNAV